MGAQQSRTGEVDSVRRVVTPVVDGAGLYLEDVAVSRAGSRSVVRITIDLPEDAVGSLDSDTLGEASRAINAALDADDVVAGAYTLEVSTPGTSRPLTEPRHFRRARTRLVTLRLADGGTATGRLTDVVDDAEGAVLVLDGDDGVRRVPLADVRKGKVEVELKRLEDDDTAGTAPGDQDAGTPREEG
jgi:ribosome maturation factor RimP